MVEFIIRPADKGDFPAIRRLVIAVRINPTGLDWRRFTVATTKAGELIGCGQVKLHRDGSRELASLAVRLQERDQGVARALIAHLLHGQMRPIHLMCRASLGLFYNKFGFHSLREDELTPYFRCINQLIRIFKLIRATEEKLLVMRLD